MKSVNIPRIFTGTIATIVTVVTIAIGCLQAVSKSFADMIDTGGNVVVDDAIVVAIQYFTSLSLFQIIQIILV